MLYPLTVHSISKETLIEAVLHLIILIVLLYREIKYIGFYIID